MPMMYIYLKNIDTGWWVTRIAPGEFKSIMSLAISVSVSIQLI
jgi:hypothetical protein